MVDNDEDEFQMWAQYTFNALKSADLIVTTAKNIQSKIKQLIRKPTVLVPNGVNYNHFQVVPTKIPNDIHFLKNKIVIGYYGALATWIDKKLVLKIAEKYNVVLIGKKTSNNGYQTIDLTLFEQHRNITVLPAKLFTLF